MLNNDIKDTIYAYIVNTLRTKLKTYSFKNEVMPFHYRLLGKDRMALFSFIHSINTMFGTSIFEQVAVRLAKYRFAISRNHIKAFNRISTSTQAVIQKIIDDLSNSSTSPNKQIEIEKIRAAVKSDENLHAIRTPLVDVWLETHDGELYLIDIKTVKPNIDSFISYKKTLLEWIAVELARNSDKKVNSLIAMPYNPYEPEPYKSWQMRGMLDLKCELLVGKEFWDFIGGEGAYEDLLSCFECAGIKLRPEIDDFFSRFNESKKD